jgi:hypothetical protein
MRLSRMLCNFYECYGYAIVVLIHSISFNVIQPMWLCRQIPKYNIADMLKLKPINKNKNKNKTQVTQ